MTLRDIHEFQIQFLQGLADKTRMRIIEALMENEKTVTELVNELHCSQANVSGHLRTLKQSGILESRQQGKYVFYSLKDPAIVEFLKYMKDMLKILRHKAMESV